MFPAVMGMAYLVVEAVDRRRRSSSRLYPGLPGCGVLVEAAPEHVEVV